MQSVNAALSWVSSNFGVTIQLSRYSKIIAKLSGIIFSSFLIINHLCFQEYADYIYVHTQPLQKRKEKAQIVLEK